MRYNFIIFILYTISALCWASADKFLCQKFDEKTGSFAHYCTDYTEKYSNETTIENCSPKHEEVEPTAVVNFEIHGCSNQTIKNFVKRFINLLKLDISDSGFRTMDSFNYSHQQVQTFIMSHNQIVDYRWAHFMDLLARFPQLNELDLSYNNLHAVHAFANQSIIKLKKLNFEHNNIAYIQKGAFVNLTELETINLSYNQLNRIYANAFSKSLALQELDMTHNPIEYFDCDDLLNEKNFKFKVYISWEYVQHFSTDCIGLDSDRNQTKSLIVSNQRQSALVASEGGYRIDCPNRNFQQIRTFIAGPNKYRHILTILKCFGAELLELDLSRNFIQNLNAATFQRFKKLTHLSLIQTGLRTFDFQVLQDQKHLISLDISNNGLESIENVILSGNLRSFETLNIAGNSLVLTDFLQYLPMTIKNLDVSNCKMVGELKREYFRNMPDLEELHLRSLKWLRFGNHNPFEALENLLVLDISHNNLRGVDLSLLAGTFEKLREFRAADCNIDRAGDLFNLFGADLWTLDLSGNFIGDLRADSPLQRLNLLGLYLNRAHISKFDLNTLQESNGLAYFEIANNFLSEIDLTPLSTNLLELKMQSNQLENIVGLIPEHFKKLRYLDIGRNHLPCEYLTELANDFARKNAHFEEWDKFAEACLKINDNNSANTEAATEATNVPNAKAN